MIFDLWPLPRAPGGGAKKMCRCKPRSCEQLTHQIWLDFVQWFRRRLRDGRTDGGDFNIPDAFLKKRGDNESGMHLRYAILHYPGSKKEQSQTNEWHLSWMCTTVDFHKSMRGA